jgi:hypothetical protein
MRAAETVASGRVIWDHIVVNELLKVLRTGLFLSVKAHDISLSTKMVILDSSNLNQPHGRDAGCFTMSVVSVAIEHIDEVEIQNYWKLKLYSAKFCWGMHDSQTLKSQRL